MDKMNDLYISIERSRRVKKEKALFKGRLQKLIEN